MFLCAQILLCFVVLRWFYWTIVFVLVHFRSKFGYEERIRGFGTWAIVTGCTSGIGLALMRELAKLNINIVLMSRNMKKLESCAQKLEEDFGVSTEILQVDLENAEWLSDDVCERLLAIKPTILVNNAGSLMDHPKKFMTGDFNKIDRIFQINLRSSLQLSRFLLQNTIIPKKKGLIVNVSSMSAIKPIGYLTCYGASKACLDFFSRSLYAEFEHSNIYVQSLLPFFVDTSLLKASKMGWLLMTPEEYAKHAICTFGFAHRCSGHWLHTIFQWIFEWLSEFGFRWGSCRYLEKKMNLS